MGNRGKPIEESRRLDLHMWGYTMRMFFVSYSLLFFRGRGGGAAVGLPEFGTEFGLWGKKGND